MNQTQNRDVSDVFASQVSSILSDWAKQHGDTPGTLYHYTSAEGLTGILSTQSLWMTDLRYMNDLSELQYPNDMLSERIEHRSSGGDLDSASREFLSQLTSWIESPRLATPVYSTSFCEDGNLLSQWRGYRGAGGGYAIGFDFFHTIRLLDRRCVLRKLIYDQSVQRSLLDTAIGLFAEAISSQAAGMDWEQVEKTVLRAAYEQFTSAVGELLFSFKHPAFQEEQEWRLLHSGGMDNRFDRNSEAAKVRTYEGNVIPYHVVSFAQAIEASKDDTLGIGFPVVDVTIGPTVNADLNRESIRGVLLSSAPDVEPRVSDSGIPLRWL